MFLFFVISASQKRRVCIFAGKKKSRPMPHLNSINPSVQIDIHAISDAAFVPPLQCKNKIFY